MCVSHRYRFIVLLIACVLVGAAQASAQPSGAGVVEGFVTTQTGTIRLGGAQVVVHNSRNQEVATVLSDGDGHFRFAALHEGKYTLTASLEGFALTKASVAVTSDATTERSLDLPLATLTQTVEVRAPASIVSSADTLGSSETIGNREMIASSAGTNVGMNVLLFVAIALPSL